jgi:hypothetical protein
MGMNETVRRCGKEQMVLGGGRQDQQEISCSDPTLRLRKSELAREMEQMFHITVA